ncbi:hypothetical protein J5U23_01604 [Saccharolobus shibatae B12]|uniref:Uncharacterized protein n=1 Tax=Saccharolobus shibatae (strain ATCC 51178 / DSM 5389 / JCM 8931 / NBRC 15437 / B12) TaxID=523848 RepID=A0A8F5BP23_SACSH|nr:hypothetical protein J5U23_01604 [Saccharolobus shibatae B12]
MDFLQNYKIFIEWHNTGVVIHYSLQLKASPFTVDPKSFPVILAM